MINVLLLYKKSAYSIYFEQPHSSIKGKVLPHEISRFEKTHRKHFECLQIVEDFLKHSNIPYSKVCRGRKIAYEKFNVIVTVGGDGTFLEAARGVRHQALLGVNSDPTWSVGRFCSANAENFGDTFKSYLDGKIPLQKLHRFCVKVRGQSVEVLNDILVCHHNPAAMSRYYLSVNGRKEEQKSSGIWVSTAVGSSGAIKSAGGRQLPQKSDQIQYRPRELYVGRGKAGYMLQGSVLSSASKIEVTSLMREGFVFVDGSHVFFPFDFGETIRIARSKYPLNVVGLK
jgi:NAD+ kinase